MNEEIRVDEDMGEVLGDCAGEEQVTPIWQRMKLEDDVKQAVDNERERAAERFWRSNHSEHESYSFIKEELEESEAALKLLPKSLKEAWTSVRENDGVSFAAYCKQMKQDAIHAACECIQLAAMCAKGEESVFEH